MVSKFERQYLTEEQIAEMEKFDRAQRVADVVWERKTVNVDDIDTICRSPQTALAAVNCHTNYRFNKRKEDESQPLSGGARLFEKF